MVAVGNKSMQWLWPNSFDFEGIIISRFRKLNLSGKNSNFFRVSELIALVSVSTTLFLFIQTRDLSHRLHEIQDPNLDLSAFGAKIDSGKSGGGRSIEEITKPKSHLSRELSNEKVNVRKKNSQDF